MTRIDLHPLQAYRPTPTPRPAPSDAPRHLRLAAEALRARDAAILTDLATLDAILQAAMEKLVQLEHFSLAEPSPPLPLLSPALTPRPQAPPQDTLDAVAAALEERDHSLDAAITHYLDGASLLAARLERLEHLVRKLAAPRLP